MTIAWFHEIGIHDLPLVGGKGANLGEMTRQGFPVPPGFCITTAAYRQVLDDAGLWPEVAARLDGLVVEDSHALEAAASQIQQAILQAPIPARLADAIQQTYIRLDSGRARVAVRSSATAEDLPAASFAGQQETYLGVQGGDDLLAHVQKCWASLWTGRAIAYRQRNAFPHAQVHLAVVVQQMVAPDVAGILFTANPLNGQRQEMLINAAYGLGESVVSGRVTLDTYRLRKGSPLAPLEQQTGSKAIRIDMQPGGGTLTRSVSDEEQQRLCLDAPWLERLHDLAQKVETHYGAPQDIEWAIAGDQLYLLQTRPITSLPPVEAAPRTLTRLERWIQEDILDHYPAPPYPLDYTAVTDSYEQLQIATRRLGADAPSAAEIIRMDENGLTHIEAQAPRLTWRMLKLPLELRRLLRIDPASWRSQHAPRFATARQALQSVDLQALSDKALVEFIQQAVEMANEIGRLRFPHYILPWMLRLSQLRLFIRLARLDGTLNEIDLLAGLDYRTVEIGQALQQLAALAAGIPAVRQVFLEHPDGQAVFAQLQALPEARAFLQALEEFFRLHGARTMKVYLPFSNRSWVENPAALYATLAVILRAGAAEGQPGAQGDAPGPQPAYQQISARQQVGGRLPAFLRPAFLKTLQRFRTGHVAREDTVYAIEQAFVLARRGVDQAVQRLVQRDLLCSAQQSLYLTLPELFAALHGEHSQDEIQRRVRQREKMRPGALAVWRQAEGASIPGENGAGRLKGIPGSPGVASGAARLITGPQEFGKLQAGDVLVCSFTDPAWTPLFLLASAVVADTGGPLSHAAIVAREYGIPAVLGVHNATQQIQDGQPLLVDGSKGEVVIMGQVDLSLANTTD